MISKLENLQFLGVFGILQETLKLIYQWRKIFTQITLAFILPFYLFAFTHMAIFLFFHPKPKPSITISPQIIYHLIFNIVSPIFSIIFALFSTATVTYTVACIYTARDVSFKHVIKILPIVWKRLLLTYLSVFVGLFAFNFVASLVIFLILVIVFSINGPNGFSFNNCTLMIIFIFTILFIVGTWYLTLIWQLSNVVSVLEELCGFKAMAKSKALVKGKMRISTKLSVLLSFPLVVIQLVFYHLIFQTPSVGVVWKCILGIVVVLSFSMSFLVVLVAKTVLYFVCKSYHHEIVDKLSLSNHLQCYLLADYVPLKDDDHIHTEKLQVV